MDFTVSEKMQTILGMINEFVDRELIPLEPEFLSRPFGSLSAAVAEKRRMVKQMELWAPNHPVEYGGMGLDLMGHALVSEALGRSPLGHYVFGCQAPDAGNIEILHQFGTPEQKAAYLGPLVAGDIRSCFSMTEPEVSGADPTGLRTRVRREGDEYVIDGHKWFTSGAYGAAFAIVMAVNDPDAPMHQRATMLIVPTDTPGFRIARAVSVMGHTGGGGHCEIYYENCRVPVSSRLGPEGAGFLIAQARLGPGRIHHCMRAIGIAERAFEIMCRHANSRKALGGTLGEKQFVQDWIAQSRMEIDQARLLTMYAAWKMDTHGKKAARQEISMIKVVAPNMLMNVLDRAIQCLGSLGVSDDTPVAAFWRHSRALRLADGPDEVHKMVIARRELKRFA
jgi:alkylation response protein AidB-like acyl-CoA dehydrogenase